MIVDGIPVIAETPVASTPRAGISRLWTECSLESLSGKMMGDSGVYVFDRHFALLRWLGWIIPV